MNSPSDNDRITIDVRLDEHDSDEAAVARERGAVRKGLTDSPRHISSKYFYDDRGSELFERITELPEYYQTRTEEALLATIAPQLVEITEAAEIVELGSGASTKPASCWMPLPPQGSSSDTCLSMSARESSGASQRNWSRNIRN